MPREITSKKTNQAANNGIIDLNGLAADEKQLYLAVIQATIPGMLASAPSGSVERQERLFRGLTKNSIELAGLFIIEYRAMKKSTRAASDNE